MSTEVMWQKLVIYLFISNSYTRNFYVPGLVLDTVDTAVIKNEKTSALTELIFY